MFASAQADGGSSVGFIAAEVDGQLLDSALAEGGSLVTARSRGGRYLAAAEADGVSAVTARVVGQFTGSARADGVSAVRVMFAPDLSDNEPVPIAVTLLAYATLTPPTLET